MKGLNQENIKKLTDYGIMNILYNEIVYLRLKNMKIKHIVKN